MVVGWARGGRLEGFGYASLKGMPLLAAAVAMVVLARGPAMPPGAAGVLQGLGYLAALVVLWRNRSHAWTLVILSGLCVNALVIALNGGRMPVSERALAGVTHGTGPHAGAALDARHSVVGPGTRLAQLGDVVPVGAWGIGTALSPGDLVMAVGLAGFVQGTMCAAWPRPPSNRRANM
jgi:hypothetical protein